MGLPQKLKQRRSLQIMQRTLPFVCTTTFQSFFPKFTDLKVDDNPASRRFYEQNFSFSFGGTGEQLDNQK